MLSYRRRPERSRTKVWLTLVTWLLLAAVLGGPVVIAYRVVHPPVAVAEPQTVGEPVSFGGSPDGPRLEGWYIPGGDRAVVLVHGYGQTHLQGAPLARSMSAAGFSVLLYDQRGHGASKGVGGTTLGAKETEDLVQAIELVKSKGAREVALVGWDLGANVALEAAARRPGLGAIVLSNPAADPVAAVQQIITKSSPLPELFFATYTRWMAGLFYGARPGELKPLPEAAQLGPTPLLVVAPSAGAEGAVQLLHAYGRPGTELLVAPDGGSPVYVRKVTSFLNQALGQ